MAFIRLRPLLAEDAETLVKWRSAPSFRDPLLGYRFPVTLEMEKAWVESILKDQTRTRIVMAIENEAGGVSGFVQLNDIDWIDRTAELAVGIGKPNERGQGIGTFATRLFIREAFRTYGLRRLFVRIAAFNESGLHFFPKFGFQHEGTLRQHVIRDGICHDVMIFGLLESEVDSNFDSVRKND